MVAVLQEDTEIVRLYSSLRSQCIWYLPMDECVQALTILQLRGSRGSKGSKWPYAYPKST
ncbi:hypothetical protein SDJN02_11246, partial [Cucurbita argyrosperma subsp. argyrosperma]